MVEKKKKKVNLLVQKEGVKTGKIGGNIGEYRGNIGFAGAILEKRNISISSRGG